MSEKEIRRKKEVWPDEECKSVMDSDWMEKQPKRGSFWEGDYDEEDKSPDKPVK